MEKSIQRIEENGFVLYIKRFLNSIKFKLFGHTKNAVEKEKCFVAPNNIVHLNSWIDEIKVHPRKVNNSRIERKIFLKQLDGNVEMLNRLSVERLEILKLYYDEVIKQNEEKLRRLKRR